MTADLDLYQYLAAWRPYLRKQVGTQDADDLLHEWFIAVAKGNRLGRIHGSMHHYAWGTLFRLMARRWSQSRFRRDKLVRLEEAITVGAHTPNPEQCLLAKERTHIACRTFRGLKPQQREVLTRFYVREEPRSAIERGMNLTPKQFQLLKWRAKAAYSERGRQIGRLA